MLRKIYLFSILLTIIIATYFNTLENDFVFDDKFLILENKTIHSLKNIPTILGFSDRIVFRPIREITYVIDYLFYQYNPKGYHLSNIFFLFLSCSFVYLISHHLFKSQYLAFITSAIFAVHPIHTEAVTYISGRKDTLAGIFYFMGFYFFIKYRKNNRTIYFIATLMAYILAIFSKEVGLTLPLVLFLYDYYILPDSLKYKGIKQIWESLKLMFKKYSGIYVSLFLFILLLFTYILFIRSSSGINYMKPLYIYGVGTPLNIYTQIKIIGICLKLLLFPINLSADYTFNVIPQSLFIYETEVIEYLVLILLTLFLAVIFLNSKNRIVSFLFLSLLASMLPVMQILKYPEIISERSLFIPSLFSCLLLTFLISKSRHILKYSPVILFILIIIIFSIRSISRNFDWKNSQTLWERTIKTAPHSARAHFNLGTIYAKLGKYQEAKAELEKSLLINSAELITIPDYSVDALLNLGNVFYLEGRNEEAIKKYQRVLKQDPGNISARRNIKLVKEKREKTSSNLRILNIN